MNEQQQLIKETTRRILSDLCNRQVIDEAEQGIWPKQLWETLEEAGLTLAGITEHAGGSGGEVADSMLVLRQAASFAAPVPLSETFIAAMLMDSVGHPVPRGPLSIVPGPHELDLRSEGNGYLLSGKADFVPWAGESRMLVAIHDSDDESLLSLIDSQRCQLKQVDNIAGTPCYEMRCKSVKLDAGCVYSLPADWNQDRLQQIGALASAVMMAGAMDSVLEICVQYVQEREQFGRPIARFQAIQHQLAVLAGQVAAASKAADVAVEAWNTEMAAWRIAVAKARVGEAAGIAAEIAHQVHGAIGYTQEYHLHHRTRRLWAWREDFGAESVWQEQLGRHLCSRGADSLWNCLITS
jgi:acyl-CoA dehydrogenase